MKLTREKHLDHMVKVVPLIVLGYAVQCYIIRGMQTPIGTTSLMVLGALLGSMIAGFIIYDIKHQVTFGEHSFKVDFLFIHKEIFYSEIHEVEHAHPEHTFGTLVLKCAGKKFRFFFIDEADKVKAFLEEKRLGQNMKKAA